MHARLGKTLKELIADDLAAVFQKSRPPILVGLVAQHVASAFVLVLNWWIESSPASTPRDVDAHFRELVVPALRGFVVHVA